MRIEEIEIANSARYYKAGDFISMQEYVLFGSDYNIVKNGKILETELPIKIEMPRITILDKSRFLISEFDLHSSNMKRKSKNAWIIDDEGKIVNHFNIGQANRLLSTNELIIASYAPSGFYSGRSPEFEVGGLAIFDFMGNCLFHLDAILPKEVNFFEIKAMSIFDNNYVYFLTYPNFDILRLKLNNFKLDIELKLSVDETNVDDSFWIPTAMSKSGSEWFFHTPNDSKSIIFKRGNDGEVLSIGTCNYSPNPKGLANGQFFLPSFSIDETVKKCKIVKCKYAA